MSLMKTLAKVAIGVAVAKGVGRLVNGNGGSASAGTGGRYGDRYSPSGRPGSTGGLEDIMGDILGGRQGRSGGASGNTSGGGLGGSLGGILGGSGGLGGLLEGLGGRPPRGRTPSGGSMGGGNMGGLGDLIGSLGGGAAAGGLGGLLGGLLGGAAGGAGGGASARPGGSFGDLLNQSLSNRGEPDVAPTPQQDAVAALMLRAMIQAAKADGTIDAAEQKKLLGNLGDVSPEERAFVEAEMRAPVDVRGLANQVPEGLETQVYTMSILAIDLDNRAEAEYLHALATGLGIGKEEVNEIHERLGVPALYS